MRYGMGKNLFCEQCAVQLTGFTTCTRALYEEPKTRGWFVISMKKDWKHILAFETK